MTKTNLVVRPASLESLITQKPLISRDNKYVICCCGADVKVFSVRSGELLHTLKGHSDLVTSVSFNPTNQYQVLSCSHDGTIRKWDFVDGVLISVVKPVNEDSKQNFVIHGMCNTQSGKKQCIYHVKLTTSEPTKGGGEKLLKQSAMMETWSSSDFLSSKDISLLTEPVVGGQDGFLAAVITSKSFAVWSLVKPGKVYRHHVMRDHSQPEVMQCLGEITCLAAHPLENCVAVGHKDGKIGIWSNVSSHKPVFTWVHWHALPVLSLAFTPEGSCLLSGGHESVLVKWPHGFYGDKPKLDFLPRMGAPISQIAVSDDNSTYVTSHLDNSVKVIKNWLVVQVYQGLTTDFLSKDESKLPAGVNFDPRSGALVINGLPGHLQFYSLTSERLLFNLDVVGQNYVSGDSLGQKHSFTTIEQASFSGDGKWLVTVERWPSTTYTQQCRMKFWYYDDEIQSYVLNTDVDTPHNGKVSSICFAPIDEDNPEYMLASVGMEEKKFKIWALTEKPGSSSQKKLCWRVESTGYYKNKSCSISHFSDDGSVFAVAFEDHLTIWDPYENHLITSLVHDAPIKTIHFCYGEQANCLLVATSQSVIMWDLMSYTEKMKWNINGCQAVAVDTLNPVAAVFGENIASIIDLKDGQVQEISLPTYGRHVLSCKFSPENAASAVKSTYFEKAIVKRLYYSTTGGSILTVEDLNDLKSSTFTPTVEQASKQLLASNYTQGTPLANLLSSRLVKTERNTNSAEVRTGIGVAEFVKQVGNTPCVAMPPMENLCRMFLESWLLDKPAKQWTRSDDSDSDDAEEMDVSSSDEHEAQEKKIQSERENTKNTQTFGDNESFLTAKRKIKKSDLLDFGQCFQKT